MNVFCSSGKYGDCIGKPSLLATPYSPLINTCCILPSQTTAARLFLPSSFRSFPFVSPPSNSSLSTHAVHLGKSVPALPLSFDLSPLSTLTSLLPWAVCHLKFCRRYHHEHAFYKYKRKYRYFVHLELLRLGSLLHRPWCSIALSSLPPQNQGKRATTHRLCTGARTKQPSVPFPFPTATRC